MAGSADIVQMAYGDDSYSASMLWMVARKATSRLAYHP